MRFLLLAIGLLVLCGTARAQPTPKMDPKEIEQLFKSEIQTVSYCDLVQNPTQYNQKLIRVHGVYAETGGEYSNLYDPTCLSNPTPTERYLAETQTWVEFNEAYESQTKPGIVKIFDQLRYYYQRADVIIVAKFYGPEKNRGYGHQGVAKLMLDVIRIEQVQPVKQSN